MTITNQTDFYPQYQGRFWLIQALVQNVSRFVQQSQLNTNLIISKPGQGNFASEMDLHSEMVLVQMIKTFFPDDVILSEETYHTLEKLELYPHLWVLDPIDGSHNLIHDRQYSAISAAYVEQGVVKLGAVINLYSQELFFASLGSGAYLNGKQIFIESKQSLLEASIATDNSYNPDQTRSHLAILQDLDPLPWISIRGSAVLTMCEVACNRYHMYFSTCLQPWDGAAAQLIISEAGGVFKNFKGENTSFQSKEVVVGGATLVDQFIQQLKA